MRSEKKTTRCLVYILPFQSKIKQFGLDLGQRMQNLAVIFIIRKEIVTFINRTIVKLITSLCKIKSLHLNVFIPYDMSID